MPDLEVSDRVLTIPNALSFLRLLGVPLFLWLILGPHEDGWALLVLAISGFTDWADGQIARRMNQTTRLGQMLDPVADRLYIFATVLGLALRDIIPWWLAIALPLRDLLLTFTLPALHRRGFNALPVHFLGKSATFCLLYAFPLLLLGDGDSTLNLLARVVGWAFAIWGTALYYWAGVLYFEQLRHLIQTVKPIDKAR
ncbi:CDP-alcohol phosphatidyltransferase family protein [Kribbella sp. NBC_01505]|uniref:CDP-alcohol phosphatidyltransferase family protein n=1 Tax=Kribbella sp. NBC_01505 TaxID=2903580 RepID=UPI0038639293